MNSHINDFMNWLPSQQPDVYKAIYPRRIVPPNGYTNPRFYGCTMWSQLMIGFEPDMALLPHTTGVINCLAQIVYRVPTYFVRSEFAQAVAQTEPPEDFKLNEIKWPLPAMLFVLPTDFVLKYFGYLCPFISITRNEPGIYPRRVLKNLPNLTMPIRTNPFTLEPMTTMKPLAEMNPINNQVERMTFVYPCYGKDGLPVEYTGSFPLTLEVSAMADASFEDATYMEEARFNPPFDLHDNEIMNHAPQGEAETAFMNKMQMFAVKLMLAVTARPNYIKLGHIMRPEKVKKGRVKHVALWGPNTIGWEYRAVRERPTDAPAGTHASPRMHWRKGHWRNQPFGPKPWTDASERRLTWIEPVLINASEEV